MQIPADRIGLDEEIAQAALMLACNQYAYGKVCIFNVAFTSLRRLQSMAVTFWHMAYLLTKICTFQLITRQVCRICLHGSLSQSMFG